MAHNLTMIGDQAKMVYAGQTPWHGLGTNLPANAAYEDIVKLCNFYTVQDVPLHLAGTETPIPDCKALIRTDTGGYLATVGKTYEIVQSSDIADTIVKASSGVKAIFHTAGSLGPRGVKGWLLGELPDPIMVKHDDSPIRKYLLGFWGHDGKTAVSLKNVATRVVCQNTLGSALKEDGAEWRIYHSANSAKRLEHAAQSFKLLEQSYRDFGELANHLVDVKMNDDQMLGTIDSVLPVPKDDKDHEKLESDRNKVYKLFHEAIGLNDNLQNTAWAAVQAWSEFSDHHRTTRNGKLQDAQSAKLESVWFGKGAGMKQKALASILQTCNVQTNSYALV
jgi:phage/plasmid-like protein (TIGR03299 family)